MKSVRVRRLHMGCGESLFGLLPLSKENKELSKPAEKRLRVVRIEKQLKKEKAQ